MVVLRLRAVPSLGPEPSTHRPPQPLEPLIRPLEAVIRPEPFEPLICPFEPLTHPQLSLELIRPLIRPFERPSIRPFEPLIRPPQPLELLILPPHLFLGLSWSPFLDKGSWSPLPRFWRSVLAPPPRPLRIA